MRLSHTGNRTGNCTYTTDFDLQKCQFPEVRPIIHEVLGTVWCRVRTHYTVVGWDEKEELFVCGHLTIIPWFPFPGPPKCVPINREQDARESIRKDFI